MFKCQRCNKVTASGERAHKIVTEKRDKTYFGMFGEIIGKGWEIVKEVMVCGNCKDDIDAANYQAAVFKETGR